MKGSLFFLLALFPFIVGNATEAAEKRLSVGWVEKIRICPEGLVVTAKIDTGARNSSLHAEDVEEFAKDGERWVRFTVVNRSGQRSTFERKLIRDAKIRQRAARANHRPRPLVRPVVEMCICVGSACRDVEVNLADRSRFNYRMLVGRSFLSGTIKVDPSRKYTVEPICSEAKSK